MTHISDNIDNILERQLKEYKSLIIQKTNSFMSYYLKHDNGLNHIINKSRYIYDNNNCNENIIYKYNDLCIKIIISSNLELIPTELQILNLLSELVINYKTPHILIPLLYGKVINLTNLSNQYKHYKLKQGCYMFTNWCNQYDLLKYMKSNYITLFEWKIILFKILYTLIIIFTKYPDFRHNDLSFKNILINKNNNNQFPTKYNLYKLNNIYYKIPIMKYEIYIWDFEFSNIDNITNNIEIDKDMVDEYGIRYSRNQYYDLHFLLNSTFHLFENSMPIIVKDFIKNNIPLLHLTKNNEYIKNQRLIYDKEFITPTKLLEDTFFHELIYENDEFTNCTCKYNTKFNKDFVNKYNY